MDKMAIATMVLLLSGFVAVCQAGCCAKSSPLACRKTVPPDAVENALQELTQKTERLESYQARIEHLVKQPLAPEIESTTLRKGTLYYQRFGRKSRLRINFETLKQDDEKEQKYVEQFVFDGVWLSKIDYQLEQVTRKQLARPNEPVDALELARRTFPIVGFSRIEELKKEFEIKLVEQEKTGRQALVQLHLKVKPNSVYKDDYTTIDFWIDENSGLPARIAAVTTEEDIYEIILLKPRVNKRIDKKVFALKIPKGFTIDEIPLKEEEAPAKVMPPEEYQGEK
ncbi:MAG: LolA family protein [Planctomycetota bacterium]|jgi:outer membrane lipoprotein-sorting protein